MVRSVSFSKLSLSRILRVGFTLYLLTAVVYTAYSVVMKPLFNIVISSTTSTSSPSSSTTTLSQQEQAKMVVPSALMETKSQFEAALGRAAKLKDDSGALFWGKSTSSSKSSKGSKSSLMSGGIGSRTSRLEPPVGGISPLDPPDGVEWDTERINWLPVSDPLAHSPDSPSRGKALSVFRSDNITMSEDFFLSKAFGESFQQSKVIPFYYRATATPNQEDITITTLVTSNRFPVLAKLVEHYQGPISVCIHVTNNPESRQELIDSLKELYASSPMMSMYLDVHLVVDNFDRQFNMWRNVARFFARTDYVMMLDVDFWICTNFRKHILGSPEIMGKLREGSAAFVVPAFEFNDQEDGMDSSTFPTKKDDIVRLAKDKKIDMFHKSWVPGHGSTNYNRFYDAKPGEVYKVSAYTHSYEPYAIFKKDGTPYCDERFVGYGSNKAACLFEMYLSGISYYVLSDDFLIHQSHPYAEKARKHERRFNRKLYQDYREEVCFRYLNQFIESGEINSGKAKNLMSECKKINGFTTAAGRLINTNAELDDATNEHKE